MSLDFAPGRALAIARKEVRHIRRDPFTLALALGLPMVLVVFFGFAIDFDVRDITLVVRDSDKSRVSRQFSEIFASSGYFRIARPAPGNGVLRELDTARASGVLLIKPDFASRLIGGRTAQAQFVLDGADNTRASAILGYLPGLLRAARRRLAPSASTPVRAAPAELPLPSAQDGPAERIALSTRFLYNHELNTRWFVIPGLAVIVMGLLAIMLTALTVAREWENGSMELLLSTPVRPWEIILGKLAPYLALGLVGAVFIYLVARLGFGVPFRGSHWLYLLLCLLFLTASLAQGLLISIATRQQQLAMQLSIITGLLPSLLLSGFVFPIESMPVFFQYFTSILSQKWFMMISRGVFLQGSGVIDLARPILGLGVIAALLLTAAAKRFKRDLEP
ncbi:MAG TPA: ABC transporter permease [Elusimicrobia bacterium]|nr:ABC transporter permease [Elusimicrobiota bacterium]HBT60559.1 ABC transporter permease [Elusimicrobiota bacterium]